MSGPIARRECLRLLVGAGGVLLVGLEEGCGAASSQLGLAYAPWDYPGTETRPEVLMAWAGLLAANPHNTQPWTFRVSSRPRTARASWGWRRARRRGGRRP